MLEPGHHGYHDVIARALHDPAAGYYAGNITGIGRGGDFSTAATLGTSLATAIARWAVEMARHSGATGLIEVGAGDGSLAVAVTRALPWLHPLRRRYAIVDSSGPLRSLQQSRRGLKARWFATMAEALADCDGKALVIGNELIDAFPPDVLEYDGARWQEAGLLVGADGTVRDELRPWAGTAHACAAITPHAWPAGVLASGQRIEHLGDFATWQLGWLPAWKSGACLWIDYGAEFPRLYHRRPHGTLRAYHRHQRLDGLDVFRRLGKQDITCDVNFTDLRAWGEAAGLQTVSLETQGEFLRRHHAARADDPTARGEAADAFMVLCQRRVNCG